MFPWQRPAIPVFKPDMEAAGIEPAQGSPGTSRFDKPHAVYVSTNGTHVKVGYSNDPKRRAKECGLELLHARWCESIDEARRVERNAHHELEEHRVRGTETFTVNHIEAIAAVERVSETKPWWLEEHTAEEVLRLGIG